MSLRPRLFHAILVLATLMAGAGRVASATEVPFLSGRVNDAAGILSSSTRAELESLLKTNEDSTSNQVAVLIIQSLEGETLEEYSIKVAETWKLGQKGKDNGVLLLVSRNDRKVRIEVGRGLEGALTDLTCGTIIRREIVPHFRDGDYDAGVRSGVIAILDAIKGEYKPDEGSGELGGFWGRAFAFIFFLFIVGLFTTVALFSTGFISWFLYVFLLPFWGLFPTAILGQIPGIALFSMYAAGFIIVKFWLKRSSRGESLMKRVTKLGFIAASTGRGSSSGSSWSSSSGSGSSFSGGGGSFGGGGSSGSW